MILYYISAYQFNMICEPNQERTIDCRWFIIRLGCHDGVELCEQVAKVAVTGLIVGSSSRVGADLYMVASAISATFAAPNALYTNTRRQSNHIFTFVGYNQNHRLISLRVK